MTCGQCHYAYVFDPKKDRIADVALRRIIEQVSDNGQYCVTRNQLAIEISRHLSGRILTKKLISGFVVAFFTTLIAGVLLMPSSWWVVAVIGTAAVFVVLFIKTRKFLLRRLQLPVQLPFRDALEIIRRYHEKHPITQLATGEAFIHGRETGASDLHFAPDAILLVPRDELVDMLVRNRFPQQHKTLVLSHSGYPKHVFEACEIFLVNNPELPVHTIHDASEKTFNWLEQLKKDNYWQRFQQRINDLGWSRPIILAQSVRLPWIKDGEITFTLQHQAQLQNGAIVPVDFPPPAPMTTMLAAAVSSGVMLAVAAETISGWSLAFEYSEDYG
jgi:hypothetical protein